MSLGLLLKLTFRLILFSRHGQGWFEFDFKLAFSA